MRRLTSLLLSVVVLSGSIYSLAATVTLSRVSVHDPSITYDATSGRYYIYGSHRAGAWSKDLMKWTTHKAPWGLMNDDGTYVSRNIGDAKAFLTNMTKKISINGEEVTFGNFDVHAWSAAVNADNGSVWTVDGNMWAPDIIYNKKMKKWCMYLSINGFKWNSSIILLTSDNIVGPYVYQGPVIFSGFNVISGNAALSYKNTDLELVIGTKSTLPTRYNKGTGWGNYWPHCIDPCVFYDEEGVLRMTYGSWSGGIWTIQLNEENGLRDYDVTYAVSGSGQNVQKDPYFGKKIAGGYYVSGEASYVEYIGGYYYLFVTYGGLNQTGGYQMRVFRSSKPDGPYNDIKGNSAIFSSYAMNYGPNSDNRGVNIFGAYGEWGTMSDGERAQGHNSIIAAEDGRTYLVYHTRFQNGGEGHAVRVHQVYQNQQRWLVVAPFEYKGEQLTSEEVGKMQPFRSEQMVGTYHLLTHKYGLNHSNKEQATPVNIELNADGTISGSYSGKWLLVDGTSYINITLNNTVYKGVVADQGLDKKTTNQGATFTPERTIAFTALSSDGVTIWGYREGGIPEVTIVNSPKQDIDHSPLTIDHSVYDLQGRRAGNAKAARGLYISSGRKHYVRK